MRPTHDADEPLDPKASLPTQPMVTDPHVDHPTGDRPEVEVPVRHSDRGMLALAVLGALAVAALALAVYVYPST